MAPIYSINAVLYYGHLGSKYSSMYQTGKGYRRPGGAWTASMGGGMGSRTHFSPGNLGCSTDSAVMESVVLMHCTDRLGTRESQIGYWKIHYCFLISTSTEDSHS